MIVAVDPHTELQMAREALSEGLVNKLWIRPYTLESLELFANSIAGSSTSLLEFERILKVKPHEFG